METLDGDTGGIGRFDVKVIEAEMLPKRHSKEED
jgi:hypothetical protein